MNGVYELMSALNDKNVDAREILEEREKFSIKCIDPVYREKWENFENQVLAGRDLGDMYMMLMLRGVMMRMFEGSYYEKAKKETFSKYENDLNTLNFAKLVLSNTKNYVKKFYFDKDTIYGCEHYIL